MHTTPALMSDCDMEHGSGKATPPSSSTTTIKICDCDCDCDCKCCVEQLYSQIEADPKLLQNVDKDQFAHTPLHKAAAEGRVSLAVEIMNLMPSLAKKLNPQGLSPLHVAVQSGKADVALALVKLDKQLVRIKGRGGLTPLHYAAVRSVDDGFQIELLAGLLAECPDAMSELNNRRQSAVHVALENDNVRAAKLLVNWVVIVAKESELSIKDAHGNTTLHIAARYCRCSDVLPLLCKLVKVNKANKYGETALDIAIRHNNGRAVEILRSAGAITRTTREKQQIPNHRRPSKLSTTVLYLQGNHADNCVEMLTRAYYFIAKELTMDMRNTILVVAVLIATTTYQGVLQPPGGVYSAEGNGTVTDRLGRAFPARRLGDLKGMHPPGRMVMGTTKYSYFMPTNTLAFMSSTLIIIFVLPDRAFIVILQACLIFMCISYLLALNFISNYNGFSKALDLLCSCILGVAFLTKIAYYLVKAYYNDDEWLLRRLGVMISNHKARFIGRDKKDGDVEVNQEVSLPFLTRARKQYKLISKKAV